MTATFGTVPRVGLVPHPSARALSDEIAAALGVLADARRVVIADANGRLDLLHTVGAAEISASAGAYRVHTIDRIPLRPGRVALTPGWTRRQRRHVGPVATWLVHGHTAGRLLVDADLAAGESLFCLPLLGPAAELTPSRDTLRHAVREQLGVPPGVRLVLGVEPHTPGTRDTYWYLEPAVRSRSDVTVARIRPAADGGHLVRTASGAVAGSFPLGALLAAADLFVADDHRLEACTPAASAVARGIPVVAAVTDSVAELVLSSGRGLVVGARGAQLAAAVLAQLDRTGGSGRRAAPPDPQEQRIQLARALFGIYRRVLCRAVVGGAA